MRWAFALILSLHGAIHLMGFLKAFGFAALPQLSQPISRSFGVLWWVAGVLVGASVVAFFTWPRGWWALGLLAVLVSQGVIFSSWTDAKFGTVANLILLVVAAHGFLTQGPTSFRAEYDREVAAGFARLAAEPESANITEADLAPLPPPVQRYLRATGALGQPRVLSYRLRFRGRIRSGANARWMPFVVDQQSFTKPPTRLFLMRASRFGLPVEAFHRFVDGTATMRVKAAGLVEIVDARGPVMNRSETVTLFNDMCLLAPGSLLDPGIEWQAHDERTATARFTNAGQTIAATLFFDEEGLLANFVSDDRSAASADGKSFTRLRFSTPVRDYSSYGPIRLAAHGEARWHAAAPEGEFVYGEFDLKSIEYNVR